MSGQGHLGICTCLILNRLSNYNTQLASYKISNVNLYPIVQVVTNIKVENVYQNTDQF